MNERDWYAFIISGSLRWLLEIFIDDINSSLFYHLATVVFGFFNEIFTIVQDFLLTW